MKPLKIVLRELDLLLTVHVMQMDKFQLICFKNNDAYFSRSGLKNRTVPINDKRWTTKNQAF